MNSHNAQSTQQQSHTGQAPVMVTGKDKTKRLVRAGIFSMIGLAILVLGVFVIGDKQKMFSDTFAVYTRFKSVEGLKSGALVMLNARSANTARR